MSSPRPLITLASASPRRSELLNQIGIAHRIRSVPVDETPLSDELPRDYVQRVAEAKARAGWEADPSLPVLAADTSVVLDETLYGKPPDRDGAIRMLSRLAGRVHEVMTAVALASPAGVDVRLSVSRVAMRAIAEAECEAYWQSGEPADKAGGYAIQGLGARFIRHLDGSYSGVMGLPLFETFELLRLRGIIQLPRT
jgi:septum formation protein